MKAFRQSVVLAAGASLLVLGFFAAQAEAAEQRTRLGAIRGTLGELSRGFTLSINQNTRYDDNIVRTANDTETLAVYGTDDASDWVSTTSVLAQLLWQGNRTSIRLSADLGYAHYFNFEEFSGLVTSGAGAVNWNFTDRCNLGLSGNVSRQLQSFVDVGQPIENFQTNYGGNADLGCFIIDRIRVNGAVFTNRYRNEEDTRKIADLDIDGYSASLAYVTAKKNEIGIRYRTSDSSRPENPVVEDLTDEIIEVFGKLGLGEKLLLEAAAGWENQERVFTNEETSRTNSSIGLQWRPTARTGIAFDYVRDIENAPDLIGTTRQTDSFDVDVSWQVRPTILAGTFIQFSKDELDGGPLSPLTGTTEDTFDAGLYLRHRLFDIFNVSWQAGLSDRSSDTANRDYEAAFGSVSIGLAF